MKEAFAYFLIVAASVIWGTMGIFAKLAFEYGIDPVTLTALRILISSTTMLVPVSIFRRKLLRLERKDMPQLLILGLFAVAFQRIVYFYAVDLTTATIAAVLFYTYPVFVTVYATLLLKERITLFIVSAVALTFLGVVLVVKAYESTWISINLPGLVFGLLAAMLFALYFLMTKRLRNNYTNWTLLLYGDGIGALALTPVICFSISEIASYTQHLWLLIFTIALFPSLMAYLLFSYALKYVEPSKGSILSVIEPLSAAFFSTIILGEKFEPIQIIGVALVLTGIVLLFQKRKPR